MEAFNEEYTQEIPSVSESTLSSFMLGIDDRHTTSIKRSKHDWFTPIYKTSLPTTLTLKPFQDHNTRNTMEDQQPVLKLQLCLLLVLTSIGMTHSKFKAPQLAGIHM